jgi:4-hydroxy-2-oxoheptanedioate aldolase
MRPRRPRPRRIREKLELGGTAYGVIVQMPSAEVVEIVGQVGYDYVWLDAEHGSFSLSELRELIRAADAVGIDSIVRVPDHNGSYIQRVLDLGAAGILVPHVRTVSEAKSLHSAVHYAPSGQRGACPSVRSVGHVSSDWSAEVVTAERDVLLIGLIEDTDAVSQIEELAQSGYFDALSFGPFDMAMALGRGGDIRDPEVRSIHQRLVNACRDSGTEYFSSSVAWEVEGTKNTGSRILTVSADRAAIFASFDLALKEQLKEDAHD